MSEIHHPRPPLLPDPSRGNVANEVEKNMTKTQLGMEWNTPQESKHAIWFDRLIDCLLPLHTSYSASCTCAIWLFLRRHTLHCTVIYIMYSCYAMLCYPPDDPDQLTNWSRRDTLA